MLTLRLSQETAPLLSKGQCRVVQQRQAHWVLCARLGGATVGISNWLILEKAGKSHRDVLLWEKSPPQKRLRMKTCNFLLDTYFHLWCRLGDMTLFISVNEMRCVWMGGRQPLTDSWRIPFYLGKLCFNWLTKLALHVFHFVTCGLIGQILNQFFKKEIQVSNIQDSH